jgi:GT2 family glycosyltransferase
MHDNAATAAPCLRAIFASSYPLEEVIIVADAPRDDTVAQLKGLPAHVIHLPENVGIGRARNIGAKAARGDVLFFTDGDVSIEAQTIEIGINTLRANSDIAAVVGLYTKRAGAAGFFSEFKALVYHFVHLKSSEESQIFIGNCGMIWKDVFLAMGGFEEQTIFRRVLEDVDLGFRMRKRGYAIALNKNMQVVHHRHYDFFGLLYSDLVKRAVPWVHLILLHRSIKFDNVTNRRNFFCLVCVQIVVFCGLSALVPGVGLGLITAAAFLGLVGLICAEWPLLRFLHSERGGLFTAGAAGMRFLFYVCGGIGIVVGVGYHLLTTVLGRVPMADTERT